MSDLANLQIKVTADVKDLQQKLTQGKTSINDFANQSISNLKKIGFEFEGLGKSSSGSLLVLKDRLTQLKGAVFTETLPGVGIAGILGFATEGIANYVASLYDAVSATQSLLNARTAVDGSLRESAAHEAGNLATLKGLVEIARDVTRSDGERSQAIGRLNKDYDVFNKSLTLSNINTAEATKLIDLQTAAIIRQAEIKGLENLITKESEKRAEALAKSIEKPLTATNLFISAVKNLFSNPLGTKAYTDALNLGLTDTQKILDDSAIKVNIYTEALKKLLSQSAKEGVLFDPNTVKKAGESIDDVLRKLRADIQLLNTEEIEFGVDKSKERFSAFLGAIKELVIKFKQDPNSSPVAGLITEAKIAALGYTVVNGFLKLGAAARRAFEHEFIAAPFEVQIEPEKKGTDDFVRETEQGLRDRLSKLHIKFNPFDNLEGLQGTYDKWLKQTEDFKAKITNIFQQTAVNIIVGFADALGEGVANIGKGGNIFAGLFASIFKALGAGVRQLGITSLLATKAILAIKATIGTTFGLGASVALIAIGTLISTLAGKLNKGVPGFAGGVNNFSGGLALVGEKGPELVNLPTGSDVIPNHRLGGIMGGGGGAWIAETKIAGQDLLLVLKRADSTYSRNT